MTPFKISRPLWKSTGVLYHAGVPTVSSTFFSLRAKLLAFSSDFKSGNSDSFHRRMNVWQLISKFFQLKFVVFTVGKLTRHDLVASNEIVSS